MSQIKIIAAMHPFKQQRKEIYADIGQTLSQVYHSLDPVMDISYARFLVNGEVMISPEYEIKGGDEIVINVTPSNMMDQQVREGAAIGGKVGGALMAIVGIVLIATGVGAAIGAALIGMGVGLVAGGTVLMYTDFSLPDNGPGSENKPYLTGTRNQSNQWGPVPVLLGKHLLTPNIGAAPYSEIVGDSQFLHQLFVAGYNDIEIDTSTYKIGETLITNYSDYTIEVIQDGSIPSDYPEVVKENSANKILKEQVDNVFTTPGKTSRIEIVLSFPRGLAAYNSDGDIISKTVSFDIYYKLSSSSTWVLYSSPSLTAASTSSKRETYGWDVAPGQYDIKIVRLTADSTSSKVLDDSYWEILRTFHNDAPIRTAVAEKLTIIGLKIKASEQLNGVVDQFNFVGQTKARTYSGAGTGPSFWTSPVATSNPAALFVYALTSENVHPSPVSDDRIDWETIEDWYTWCDTNGWECNGVITGEEKISDILKKIASTGRAQISQIDDKFTIIHDTTRPSAVQQFTPRNSSEFQGTKSFPESAHALKCNFVSAQLNYQFDELIVYDDGYSSANATKFQSIDIWGITDPDQVWKLARYKIAVGRLRPEVFTFSVDFEHMVCTRGDRIKLTHDVPLFGIQAGRVSSLVQVGGFYTGFVSDEILFFETGKSYACTFRYSDGSIYRITLLNPGDGEFTEVEFGTAVPVGGSVPDPGDLFSFGEYGEETVDLIIIDIQAKSDLAATITAVEYAPDIFTADSGTIPAYDPKITVPGDVEFGVSVQELIDSAADIKDLTTGVGISWTEANPAVNGIITGRLTTGAELTYSTVGRSKIINEHNQVVFVNRNDNDYLYLKTKYEIEDGDAITAVPADWPVYNVDRDEIIYINQNDGSKLYRKNRTDALAGTAITTVAATNPVFIGSNILLYLDVATSKVYSIAADASGGTGTLESNVIISDFDYDIDNDKLLYCSPDNSSHLYQKDLGDDLVGMQLTTVPVSNICYMGFSYVGFINLDDVIGLFEIKLVGVLDNRQDYLASVTLPSAEPITSDVIYSGATLDGVLVASYSVTGPKYKGSLAVDPSTLNYIYGDTLTGIDVISNVDPDDIASLVRGDIIQSDAFPAGTAITVIGADFVMVDDVALSTNTTEKIYVLPQTNLLLNGGAVIAPGSIPARALSGGSGSGSSSTGIVPYNGTTPKEGFFHGGANPLATATEPLGYSGFFYATRSYNAVYNDLAEYFLSDGEPEVPGKVYVLDDIGQVTVSKKRADKTVIGVCSDTPAFVMKAEYKKRGVCIGLSGTVNVEVVGKVEIGDLLVSGPNGVALKANWFEKLFKRECLLGKVIYSRKSGTALMKIGV